MSESIIEKALLEAEQLEETMKSNAKEILSSTMKEEIHDLVKESLTEEDDYLKEQEEIEQESNDNGTYPGRYPHRQRSCQTFIA